MENMMIKQQNNNSSSSPENGHSMITTNKYRLWNVYYHEAFYAGSDMLKSAKSNRRNVFTWHKKPDSNQFLWNFVCLKKFI